MAAAGRANPRAPTEQALGWLLAAAAAEFALLAVTGLFLVFFYRPSAANAWGDVKGLQTAVTVVDVVRFAHRLASYAFGLTLLALAIIGVALSVRRSLRTRRHGLSAAAAVGAAVVGLFASFTGYLLPWDQLALWSVTVGTNMMGFRPILNRSVEIQYVLIDGATVSVGTIRSWFYIHVLVLPALLLALGLVIARRLGTRRDQPECPTGLRS